MGWGNEGSQASLGCPVWDGEDEPSLGSLSARVNQSSWGKHARDSWAAMLTNADGEAEHDGREPGEDAEPIDEREPEDYHDESVVEPLEPRFAATFGVDPHGRVARVVPVA